MQWASKRQRALSGALSGFTIVELLIVVVVIAILAAITIVAYNGIQQRAKTSALQSALSQVTHKIEAYKVSQATETYPATLADAGISNPPSGLSYSVNPTGKGYCLVNADDVNSYYTTQASTQVNSGSCVTASGLLAWWPMNGNTNDASGNGINGVGTNLVSAAGQNGSTNGSYAFNGSTSVMRCGDGSPALLQTSTDLTISAWANVTAASSGMSGIVNYGTVGYWLTLNPDLKPGFYLSTTNPANSNLNLSSPNSLNVSQWYYLTATYTSGARLLYVNGSLVASDTSAGPVSSFSPEQCQVGSVKYIAGRFMNGRIDDVRIYGRVLSTSEIQAVYAAGAQ